MQRDESFDWVKGVAISLMVYGHVNHVGLAAAVQKQNVGWIYTFHMPVFFLLSGRLYKYDRAGVVGVRNLFRRLIFPYLAFLSVYLTALLLASRFGVQFSNAPHNPGPIFWKSCLSRPAVPIGSFTL